MRRDFVRLTDARFDLVVVGGGIYGATLAWVAVRRGLQVALVERDDWGAATSANSLRIVHGGLRYLQKLDLRRMRRSIAARREFLRRVPHLVRPMAFLVPTWGRGLHGPAAMGAALAVNDLVSLDRNRGVHPANRIPRGRVFGRERLSAAVPGLELSGFNGCARWYDGFAADAARLTLWFVREAAEAGAVCVNHCECLGFGAAAGRVARVRVKDRLSGREAEIATATAVLTAGPWGPALAGLDPDGLRPGAEGWAKAFNLVVRRPLGDGSAFGLWGESPFYRLAPGRGNGRFYFFVPWQGGTLIGTAYVAHPGPPRPCRVEAAEIEAFVSELRRIWPASGLQMSDVAGVHAGLLPVEPGRGPGGEPVPAAGCVLRHLEDRGLAGLWLVDGEKLTTAVVTAREVLETIGMGGAGRHTAAGRPQDDDRERPRTDRLGARYGRRVRELEALMGSEPELSRPLASGLPVLGAEAAYAIRAEMAVDLEDLVVRRLGIAPFGPPGRGILEACADVAAKELGWSPEQKLAEIRACCEGMGHLGGSVRTLS